MYDKIKLWAITLNTPFGEALKEAFRVTLFSVPGELILWIENKDLAYKVVIINLILIFLRSLDKYLHEKNDKGLSPV